MIQRHSIHIAAASVVALVAAGCLSAGVAVGQEKPKGNGVPAFETDIRPILQAKCWSCHGKEMQKAELALHAPTEIRKGSESGPIVVPGKAEESLLFEKVRDGEMPPDGKNPLTAAEIELFKRWIDGGAPFGDGGDSTAEVSQHSVLPILLLRCTVCHGARKQEGGLDLRSKAAMLRGGKSGAVIVPGKPDESLLLKRIAAGQMPPKARLIEAMVKPMDPEEIKQLTRWIALGAPEVPDLPDVAGTSADTLVTAKDREFWSFQPPRPVVIPIEREPLPGVNALRGVAAGNPIDAFVLQKLRDQGLSLSPETDRLTLLRRATFDLTGLPPEPSEAEAFLADTSPDAYERLIDRLLASPRYGERWGRHWLDVAGYADCEGRREQHLPRPFAWRYRDYVIRAFNADKPYDRFLLEQIAGDELVDYEHAAEITRELEDNLVATAFMRMSPDPTWANLTGFVPDRLEVMADAIDVLGSGVMGLTLKCCRCHSHKFDPLPHRDYYRMVAVFKGAYDEHDWLKPEINQFGGAFSAGAGERYLSHVNTAERKRWQEATGQRPPEPRVMALWDRGEPSPTYIYRRGDYQNFGPPVSPGPPAVVAPSDAPFKIEPPWPGAKKTGRRLAFARWLTRSDNPLTARVMVNRLWQHHFGQGLVRSVGNFGKAGDRPTHPELLDWLAIEFVGNALRGVPPGASVGNALRGVPPGASVGNALRGVPGEASVLANLERHGGRSLQAHSDGRFLQDGGWSLKQMHRLMMTSATYRQSSVVAPLAEERDPQNRLLSRMPLRRLAAEELRDTLLLVAGRLDETRFGPADPVQVRPDGLVNSGSRRSVYVQQLRKHPASLLDSFDLPAMNPNCLQRVDSLVAPQALHLLNDTAVREYAAQLANRLLAAAAADPARQVRELYWITLSRAPTAEEQSICLQFLAELTAEWIRRLPEAEKPSAQRRALATVCHTLLNSAAFLYVD